MKTAATATKRREEGGNNMSTRANHSPQLSPEAAAARRAYHREWNRKNPEKLKRYNREFWERKGAEFRAARAAQEQEEKENA